VIRSGRLALGPKIAEFEGRIAGYIGVKHAVAASSGTAALHLIVRALGIGPGDEVLVPSFTFAASVNVLLYEGATPVFVDVDPATYNLDPADVERRITPRSRAIMVVDVFGHPAEWDDLQAIADRHGLLLIDDCCEALGAEYRGRKIGQFGRAGAFAFYPNKQMTTGEGGIVVTDDDELARIARSLANQGRGAMGAWLEHERLGYNYRLNEMAAALGISQLARLPQFLDRRERVARAYTARLGPIPGVRPPVVKSHVRSSWFVYVITLADGRDRDPIMRHMEERGIPVRGYFAPIHTQPYIQPCLPRPPEPLPVTESIARRTVALPFHNNLTDAQIERVCAALSETLAR
jgi:perosamine synthetase